MAYRSCINWYGGKFFMAKDIIRLFPEHDLYVEGFGGAGHILFKKDRSKKEVYNDKNISLYNFFKTIQDDEKREDLLFRLRLTPYSREEFMLSKIEDRHDDEIEVVRKFYVRTMQSVNSIGESWAFSTTQSRRGMCQSVSKFLGHVDTNIEKSSERLQEVTIENLDIIDLLDKYDNENTLFYLDPPYVSDTRVSKKIYTHEMPNDKQKEMIDRLLKVKGKVVLSGYENQIYDKLVENGWNKLILGEFSKKSSKTGSKGIEVIWKNF